MFKWVGAAVVVVAGLYFIPTAKVSDYKNSAGWSDPYDPSTAPDPSLRKSGLYKAVEGRLRWLGVTS